MKKSFRLIGLVFLLTITTFGVATLVTKGKGKLALATPQETAIKTTKKIPPLPTVKVEAVKQTTLSETIDLTGTVSPTRTARIASPGEGPIERCHVREGDWVKRGQVLVELGRHEAIEAQIASANQSLKEQEIDLARIEQLVDSGAIPGEQLNSARSKYEYAKSQLSKSIESHSDYTIISPWDGIVSKVNMAEGDYVVPRTPLIEIFDPKSLVIQFSVPEARSTEVKNGMGVEVQLDAHPNQLFQAEITRVYPQLDTRTRMRTVEASLKEHVSLLPGMFARLKVLILQTPHTITVPIEAISQTSNGNAEVFLYREGKAVRQKVQLGSEDNNRIHIVEGLQVGDLVIVAGNEKLKSGSNVRVIKDEQL